MKVKAKDIIIKTIDSASARKFVKLNHYSGKVANNSNLHFGVFLNNVMSGVLQYGPPIDKRRMLHLVKDAEWGDIIELNRMVFTDRLPRNSESRAIAYTIRLLKKHRPNIKAIISFADACQCGDGAIYRASGFYLTALRKNRDIKISPYDGTLMHSMTALGQGIRKDWRTWETLEGFQLRYIHTLGRGEKVLNTPIIPFAKIEELGVSMYKGKKRMKHLGDAVSDQED